MTIKIDFGLPLPSDLEYAVSFSIPTWHWAMRYVDKDPKALTKMITGYPRHFPQPPIKELCNHFLKKYGNASESCRPFPSISLAKQCLEYVKSTIGPDSGARIEIEDITLNFSKLSITAVKTIQICAVIVPEEHIETVGEYWKLRGECVSSRLAAFVNQWVSRRGWSSTIQGSQLRVIMAINAEKEAKSIIKKRIADNHVAPFNSQEQIDRQIDVSLDFRTDVHLVSSGMSSIFTVREFLDFWEQKRVHEAYKDNGALAGVETSDLIAIIGFPFKATQVIMHKFGSRLFFGYGDSRDIDNLERFLKDGGRILGVFVEAPSNPLLNMPDFNRLRRLADNYEFAIVIDDTIGGLNVKVLPYADFVCTSLTKFFNGSSNLMGGSIILNPKSPFYLTANEFFNNGIFEDLFWCEDAVVLEENSRDFEERTLRSNSNTEALLKDVLLPEEGKLFKKLYYPTLSSHETLANYDSVRTTLGGYGNLFSLVFYDESGAAYFYDSLRVYKGPSNGTNFTLASPYVHLAHHTELHEVSEFGVDPNLIRVSVGLEDTRWLIEVFSAALKALEKTKSSTK